MSVLVARGYHGRKTSSVLIPSGNSFWERLLFGPDSVLLQSCWFHPLSVIVLSGCLGRAPGKAVPLSQTVPSARHFRFSFGHLDCFRSWQIKGSVGSPISSREQAGIPVLIGASRKPAALQSIGQCWDESGEQLFTHRVIPELPFPVLSSDIHKWMLIMPISKRKAPGTLLSTPKSKLAA